MQLVGRELCDEIAHTGAGKLLFARHDLIAQAEGFAQSFGRIGNGPGRAFVGIARVEQVALQSAVGLAENIVAHGHVEHELQLVFAIGSAVVLVDLPAFLFQHHSPVGFHQVDAALQTEHFTKERGFDANALFVREVQLVFECVLAQVAQIALLLLGLGVEFLSIEVAGGKFEGVVGKEAARGVGIAGFETVHLLVEHLPAQTSQQGVLGSDEGIELFQHVPFGTGAGGDDALGDGRDVDQVVGLQNDEFGKQAVAFAANGHKIQLHAGLDQLEQIAEIASSGGVGSERELEFGVAAGVGGADRELVAEHGVDHHAQTFFGEGSRRFDGGEVAGQQCGEFGRHGGLLQTGDQIGQCTEVARKPIGEFGFGELVGASPTHAEVVGGMIERVGKTTLRVQIVQARERTRERSGRIGGGFVHQFHKKTIGHAAAPANVVLCGGETAPDIVVVVIGRGVFHRTDRKRRGLTESDVVDDGAAHQFVETAHELLAHHGELGAEHGGAHLDPQGLVADKPGGGVRCNGFAHGSGPGLHNAIFEQRGFQSAFAQEIPQHVAYEFSVFAFHCRELKWVRR